MTPSAPLIALAAAAAPEAHEQQLMDVDGTSFVMLGLFLVTLAALGRWLWRPYLELRDERVRRVDGFRGDAARLDAESAAHLARVEAELAEARRAGSQERARARTEALAQERRIVAEAQAAAHRALADARARVEAMLAAESARAQERAALLGREIAEKIVGRPVAP